jgi:hypothetical protein
MEFRVGDLLEHVDAIGGRVFTVYHIQEDGQIFVVWDTTFGKVCCDTPQPPSNFIPLGSTPPAQGYLDLFI